MTRYKQPRLRITLEDRPGLEVFMRGITIGRVIRLSDLAEQFRAGKLTAEGTSEMFDAFAERLVSWNIDDDDDKPVPADLDGVRSLDADLLLQLLEGWFEGLTRAPKASTTPAEPSGSPSLQDLPMSPLRAV